MPISRRDFIQQASLASGSLLLPANQLKPLAFSVPRDFSIKILATNWGFKGSLDDFCRQSKQDKYDGIEVWVPRKVTERKVLQETVDKHGLALGLLAGAGGNDFQKHFDDFKGAVEDAVSMKPLFVNCHSGRDYFTFEQNQQFIDFTTKMSKETGVPVIHETHRARILYAAHVAKQHFEAAPDLRVTLDISHWTNVHSSLLQDQEEAVELALSRTSHIHSRVGHENAPQISDPRTPEWNRHLEAHFSWWDKVVKQHVEAGKMLTMTTEFGPPSYMPTQPFTNLPITDLWAINVHMKDLWRERYK